MPYDTVLADRVRKRLAQFRNIERKKMFGCVAFLMNGNVLVGIWKESLIVRVGPKAYDAALDERHVSEFDITGRPMRGWVVVAPEGVAEPARLDDWIDRACEFVETLPPK